MTAAQFVIFLSAEFAETPMASSILLNSCYKFWQHPRRPTQSGTVPLFVEQFHFLWNSSTFCGTVPQFVEQFHNLWNSVAKMWNSIPKVVQRPKKWNRSCKRVSVPRTEGQSEQFKFSRISMIKQKY